MRRKLIFALAALITAAVLAVSYGCSVDTSNGIVTIGDTNSVKTYVRISCQEAKEIIDSGEDIKILDVRKKEEYDAGHIPNAILLPSGNIRKAPPEELPNQNQKILIYCRNGSRSAQAARKLVDMGYTNVYDFGGINTWPYDLVTDDGTVSVSAVEEEPVTEAETQQITISPSSLLTSTADIGLYDYDGQDYHYAFIYNNEVFNAYYTPDNWCVIDSYKISNKTDIEIICQALADIHPIHSADMAGWRTPQDMAYEWTQHNIAYSLLSDTSEWKDSAKDVDIDPPDQGKSVYQLFKDRISVGE